MSFSPVRVNVTSDLGSVTAFFSVCPFAVTMVYALSVVLLFIAVP